MCRSRGKDHRRVQAVRIASTRPEASLLQSTAFWVTSFSGNEGRTAQAWVNVGRVCGSLPGTSGIRKDGRRERGVGVGSGEAGESSNAHLVGPLRCQHGSWKLQEEFMVQKGTCSLSRQEVEFNCPNGELIERTSDYVVTSQSAGEDQEYGRSGRLRLKTAQCGDFSCGKRQRVSGIEVILAQAQVCCVQPCFV